MFRKKAHRDEMDESAQDEGERDILELTKQEQEIAKQSFQFYKTNKGGASDVERFELGMLLEGKNSLFSSKHFFPKRTVANV